jgi:hypothetical protein
VDRVGAGATRGLEDEIGTQVGPGRRASRQSHRLVGLADVRQVGVRIGVDRHGLDAEPPAGAEHPGRDLGPVGDQKTVDHGRKTPNRSVPA